jgi:thiosulfate reductase cytochrome b subunit
MTRARALETLSIVQATHASMGWMEHARRAKRSVVYEKHDAATRVLHSMNLIAMAVVIITGVVIWGDDDVRTANVLHFSFAFALIAVGTAYALALAASGRWRMFLPTRATVKDAGAVVRSELGAASHEPALVKYNGAQRLAYGAVILMAAAEVLTGCALYFHHQAPWLAAALGGRHLLTTLHIAFMFGIIAFALVHVVQVLRAGLPALVGMIGGTEPTKGNVTFDGGALADPRLVRTQTQAETEEYLRARTRRYFLVTVPAVAAATAVLAFTGLQVSSALNPRQGPEARAASSESAVGERATERDGGRDRNPMTNTTSSVGRSEEAELKCV